MSGEQAGVFTGYLAVVRSPSSFRRGVQNQIVLYKGKILEPFILGGKQNHVK